MKREDWSKFVFHITKSFTCKQEGCPLFTYILDTTGLLRDKAIEFLEARKMEWKIGDILKSEHGYHVIVQRGDDGELEGRLICDPGHPCEHIPYSLSGKHTLMKGDNNGRTAQ